MPMNSPADLLANPQLRATGFLRETVHPTEGPLHVMTAPTKWSGTVPARESAPAPRLGEHTAQVLREAGYSEAAVRDLLASGACTAASP